MLRKVILQEKNIEIRKKYRNIAIRKNIKPFNLST